MMGLTAPFGTGGERKKKRWHPKVKSKMEWKDMGRRSAVQRKLSFQQKKKLNNVGAPASPTEYSRFVIARLPSKSDK